MFSRAISLQLLLWNTYVAAQSLLTLTASLPGNPLDGLAVNADGESFALGGFPSYYCPSSVEPNCPNTTETIFTPGLGALDVEVPGGQQVYISSDGELGFTQAHSAYVPPGAYYGGWINVTIVSDCAPTYTVLTWTSATTEGVFACLEGTSTYKVYVNTPAFNNTGCTQLNGLLPNYLPSNGVGPGAWQYV